MDQEAVLREDAEAQLLREAHQRRFIYRDVEELIGSGFLSHTLIIEGVPVTLRSLLPEDTKRFHARVAHLRREGDVLRWSLASAVWMVDGFEVAQAQDDPNAAYHLYQEWVQDIPMSLVESLIATVLGFRNRINRAIRLTEAFCYETYSRSMWRMQGRPTTGLGNASVVRRLWVAYNLTEDQGDLDDRQWIHTRMIVGSMSNKASKYITEELKKAEERETGNRQRVIEEAVNWVIQGEKEEQKPLTITVNGKEMVVPKIHSAQSTADLEEEMRRVFSGEKDWHDYLVDQYQKSIKERVLRQREEKQQMILAARKRSEEAEADGSPALVGYTQDQLQQLRPDISTQKTTASESASQSNFLFEKYFNPELRPGVLTPSLRVEDPGEKEVKAFGKTEESPYQPTLQEKIAQRNPKMG